MVKKELTIGKMRSLQSCSTARGTIAVLALDHRNNLRNALRPENPDSVSDEEMAAFKNEVVAIVSPAASAVLLDPEVGIAPAVSSGALPGNIGLLCAVEATGYTGDPTARKSQVLPGWSVKKAARTGANAIKLLVYYHPDAPAAGEIEQLVHQIAQDCQDADLPLFLEPLSYSPDPGRKKLLPEERHRVVIETAHRLTGFGVDILKAEFPLDVGAISDERQWDSACRELSDASQVPWVLLSAAVNYDTFLRQVVSACENGASGVAVGRAVWQEAPELSGNERTKFLRETAYPRMARVTALCNGLAHPWTEMFFVPQPGSAWYQNYPENE